MLEARSAFVTSERIRSHPVFRVLFTLAAFLCALAIRFFFDSQLPAGFPFLTFFPAVIVTSVIAGTRAGIACSVLSLLAAWYWFIPPPGRLFLDSKAAVALVFFAVVAGVDILIIHWMRRSMEALAAERETTARLAAAQTRLAHQHEQLFQELQHRVSNNFQVVSSLLAIQQRKVRHIPEAADALKEAGARLDMMSRVHRRLYLSSTDGVVLGDYLKLVCTEILAAGNAAHARVVVEAENLHLSVDQLTNLSLIALEALMNAVKYGLPADEEPVIRLEIAREADGRARFSISDNGPGYPDQFEAGESRQLGFRLLRGFADSLGGELQFLNTPGATVRVTFPL